MNQEHLAAYQELCELAAMGCFNLLHAAPELTHEQQQCLQTALATIIDIAPKRFTPMMLVE